MKENIAKKTKYYLFHCFNQTAAMIINSIAQNVLPTIQIKPPKHMIFLFFKDFFERVSIDTKKTKHASIQFN